MASTFDMSKVGFQLALGLTGVMSFWLGMMKIAERAGIIEILNRLFSPVFRRFFPTIPENHPAISSMTLNLTANMLGIDNAATPFGLKAMEQLQELNPHKEKASDAQIMFLVINTSAVTIIPISIFTYLFELGFKNPTEVFFPILIATFSSTLAGVSLTCFLQKIPMLKSGVLAILAGSALLIFSACYYINGLSPETLNTYSFLLSNLIIFSLIISFLTVGLYKRIDVYDAFIEGAKDGFSIAIGIIPYLIAMLVGIGIFRASGSLDILVHLIEYLFQLLSQLMAFTGIIKKPLDSFTFAQALPTALMKPLSGSGARAMMIDTIKANGVDSLVSKMVAIIQGSTETTFYVLAVYFGSVKIRLVRYAPTVGLFADFVGVMVAILVSYFFFLSLA